MTTLLDIAKFGRTQGGAFGSSDAATSVRYGTVTDGGSGSVSVLLDGSTVDDDAYILDGDDVAESTADTGDGTIEAEVETAIDTGTRVAVAQQGNTYKVISIGNLPDEINNYVWTDNDGLHITPTEGEVVPGEGNVLIDSDSLDIRVGADTVASFGAKTVIGNTYNDNTMTIGSNGFELWEDEDVRRLRIGNGGESGWVDIAVGGIMNLCATSDYNFRLNSYDFVPFAQTDSGWTYIRLAKFYICWRDYTIASVPITSAWGGVYSSGSLTTPNFPVTFASAPWTDVQLVRASGNAWVMRNPSGGAAPTVSNPGTFQLERGNSATLTNVTVRIVAIGTI